MIIPWWVNESLAFFIVSSSWDLKHSGKRTTLTYKQLWLFWLEKYTVWLNSWQMFFCHPSNASLNSFIPSLLNCFCPTRPTCFTFLYKPNSCLSASHKCVLLSRRDSFLSQRLARVKVLTILPFRFLLTLNLHIPLIFMTNSPKSRFPLKIFGFRVLQALPGIITNITIVNRVTGESWLLFHRHRNPYLLHRNTRAMSSLLYKNR